jgi:hypothetical protein
MTPETGSGTSFIGENPDQEEGGRAAGTFGVHWEAEDGSRWKDGPSEVSIEEAIAWARERAEVVNLLLLDGTMYSAGDVPSPGDEDEGPLPEWPKEGLVIRPRPIDSPLDGSVQELSWPFTGRLRHAGISEQVRRAVEARVRSDERVDSFDLVPHRGLARANEWDIHLAMTARGTTTAILAADALISTAVIEALPGDLPKPAHAHLELTSLKG